ncbi:DUF5134 domain-containing protein [Pseudonocardia humida]|uniref:DUF5134 domain-containing protein n=1 Tax=Pseudonocardia humida TaxID=2800819 RepID=A0ABT1AAW1_9PSEU|nr:DUF5134 domain-containing protein [Pseudonocardia humida]MCO1660159.1 DUF5134 domain-containing protein [Pseudonocardia humida]
MDWVSAGLALVCLAVVALHLARLAVHATAFGDIPGGPVGEVSHATMALGMAAMFSPLGDPLPAPVWTVAFVLCGAWFAAVALRTRSFDGDAGHHVVGSAAMLFMLLSGHDHTAVDATADAAHAGHHGAAGGGVGAVSLVAILLAGYFAWHALRCSDRLRVGGHDAPSADAASPGTAAVAQRTGVLRSTGTAALAHVVMAVAMTVMLLTMV